MSRRKKIWLTLGIVLIGLPLAALVVGWCLIHSGRVERYIEAKFSQRLPGRLHVGSFELASSSEIVLRDLVIDEAGEAALVTVAEVHAKLSLRRLRLEALAIDGVRMRLDAKSFALLNRILDTESAIPPSGKPHKTPIDVTGELVTDTGLRVSDIVVKATDNGPETTAQVTARYGDEPVQLSIDIAPVAQGSRHMRIGGKHVKGLVAPVIDALVSIKLLAQVPPFVRQYLPEVADASGTVVDKDLSANSFTGSLIARWPLEQEGAGSLSATLTADVHRLTLTKLIVKDATVITAEGKLSADLDNQDLAIDLISWHPGSRLTAANGPIPPQVPVEELLKQVPALRFQCRLRENEEQIVARLFALGQAQSSVELSWKPDAPLKVDAIELPLTLAQSFLPKAVTINGGQAAKVSLTIDGTLRACDVEARQARFSARGWSFGPASGFCRIDPVAAGGFSLAAELRQLDEQGRAGAGRLGVINYSNNGAATSTMHVEVKRVEDMLIRIHGPVQLPDLRGGLSFDMRMKQDEQSIQAHVERLALDDLTLPDLLQELVATIRGDFVWRPNGLDAHFGGQLHQGQLRLPGTWLDIAARNPLFTAAFVLTPAEGYAPAALDVSEILVRAADAKGEPMALGYSAQLGGNLTATGTGQIRGVVDHADLGWVNSMLPLDPGSMSGQGAIAISADLFLATVMRLEGSFLPLNADLRIGKGFQATGITGAVQFIMEKNSGDKRP